MNRGKRAFRVLKTDDREKKDRLQKQKKRVLYITIGILTAIIALHMSISWLYARVVNARIKTIVVDQIESPQVIDVEGIVTRQEQVIFATTSGYFKPVAEKGRRVPVGGELVRIIKSPPPEADTKPEGKLAEEELEEKDFRTSVAEWLAATFRFHRNEEPIEEENAETDINLSSGGRRIWDAEEWESITAPVAGLVSYNIDGMENLAAAGFKYYTAEEYQESCQEPKALDEGCFVQQGDPLVKIIDNFRWCYSIVLERDKGELLASRNEVKIKFPSSEKTVDAKLVDLQIEGKNYNLTYEIEQDLPLAFEERWLAAEIIYKNVQGVVLPRQALVKQDGKEGIFTIQGNVVVFEEVEIVKDFVDKEEVMDKELPLRTIVIAEPSQVKEGQRLD